MPASTIRITKESIILWAAGAYNFDVKNTGLVLDKTDPNYIEVLWDAQAD